MREATTLEKPVSPWPVRCLNRGAALAEKAGLGPKPLTAAQLIAKARDRYALDDFGPGDFFEPLSRLLESAQRDARLNLVGKFALYADTLQCLRNRLLLQRDRKRNPAIDKEEVRAPVFILGLPRTGTTILHTLLAADPQHQAPLTWQVMEPSPLGNSREGERIRRASRSLQGLQWLAPDFPRLHAVGARLPQECVSLTSLSFLSDQFDTMYNIPSYRAWYLQQSMGPAYECHRRFLQHLQFRRKSRRWVLKAPAHMFALRDLLSVYPDASFVQTHRAPLDAITSVSSLVTMLRRIFSDSADPSLIGREALSYWADATERFMSERDRLSRDRVLDLSFDEIKRDPIEAVRRVYSHFSWSLSEETVAVMRRVLAAQPADQTSFHRYNPSQFGLRVDDVERLFGNYCARFGVPAQENGHSPQPAVDRETIDFSLGNSDGPKRSPVMPLGDEQRAAVG
jgi:Sulfotransferase family